MTTSILSTTMTTFNIDSEDVDVLNEFKEVAKGKTCKRASDNLLIFDRGLTHTKF